MDSFNELTHSVDAASFIFRKAFNLPYGYEDRDGEKCMSLDANAKAGLTMMETLQEHSFQEIFHDVRNHMQAGMARSVKIGWGGLDSC